MIYFTNKQFQKFKESFKKEIMAEIMAEIIDKIAITDKDKESFKKELKWKIDLLESNLKQQQTQIFAQCQSGVNMFRFELKNLRADLDIDKRYSDKLSELIKQWSQLRNGI